MPDKYYVYTVVFSRTPQGDTRFIGFQKKAAGYFFSRNGGGVILPKGQSLVKKGGGKFALPGGTFEGTNWDLDADVLEQCQKEFTEECGRQISFLEHDEIIEGGTGSDDDAVHSNAYLQRFSAGTDSFNNEIHYAAMCLQVADAALPVIADYIGLCLAQAAEAENDIIHQVLKANEYDEIGKTYPLSPLDDEIDLTTPPIREIKKGQFAKDPLIKLLESDSHTDWFAEILKGLENIGL